MKKLDCICIVDDDEIYAFLLKKALNKLDICNEITIYINGQVAIDSIKELIEANQVLPDIILLDINMPLLDGWEFLDEYAKIKNQLTKQIAIYIASSSISIGDKNKAKDHHEVIDFLVKPINIDTILNISSPLRISKVQNTMKAEDEMLEDHFDNNKLMERLDNDSALIDQILVLTKVYLIDFMPILDNLIQENNVLGIKSHVHKMKGTAMTVCFNNIAKQTAELELIENYYDEKYLNLKGRINHEINYLIKMMDDKEKVSIA